MRDKLAWSLLACGEWKRGHKSVEFAPTQRASCNIWTRSLEVLLRAWAELTGGAGVFQNLDASKILTLPWILAQKLLTLPLMLENERPSPIPKYHRTVHPNLRHPNQLILNVFLKGKAILVRNKINFIALIYLLYLKWQIYLELNGEKLGNVALFSIQYFIFTWNLFLPFSLDPLFR